jgi:hypothetical protein
MTVDVHMPASTLKADISNLLHVMPGCLKLVAHGRVLDDSEPLMLQGLKVWFVSCKILYCLKEFYVG